MIKSFACKETEKVFYREHSRRFSPVLARQALKKLLILHAVTQINSLRIPPSNHLEKLKGEREGVYSIRVNDQWRICFLWRGSDAFEVEIIDYH